MGNQRTSSGCAASPANPTHARRARTTTRRGACPSTRRRAERHRYGLGATARQDQGEPPQGSPFGPGSARYKASYRVRQQPSRGRLPVLVLAPARGCEALPGPHLSQNRSVSRRVTRDVALPTIWCQIEMLTRRPPHQEAAITALLRLFLARVPDVGLRCTPYRHPVRQQLGCRELGVSGEVVATVGCSVFQGSGTARSPRQRMIEGAAHT